jgi:hypothetical protein
MTAYPEPYPIYEQPDEFKDEFDHERSRDLAKKHFEWFVENVPNRVSILLGYFSFQPGNDARNNLLELGSKITSCINLPWCTVESTPFVLSKGSAATWIDQGLALSPRGRSLAIDMGIYLAKILLDANIPSLQWKLITRSRNDIHYQSAVLSFDSIEYDPKQNSIANLSAVIHNEEDSSVWLKVYDYVLEKCQRTT